jgi:hypothetical protein
LVEHQLWELAVAGSNPVAPTISLPGVGLAKIFFAAQIPTFSRRRPLAQNKFPSLFTNETGPFLNPSAIGIGIAKAAATRVQNG